MKTVYLLIVALIAGAVALVPVKALAQSPSPDDRIGLSTDGVSFTDSLTDPLFDPAVRWVPGDVRTATFFVRNRAESQGSLDLSILRVERDDLIQTRFLTVSARAGSADYATVDNGGAVDLLDGVRVEAGETIPIRVRIRLREEAPNSTQVLGTDLALRVDLRDTRAIDPSVPDGPDGSGSPTDPTSTPTPTNGPSGILPDTGAPITRWTVPLALLLVVIGAFLALGRRPETEGEQP